MSRAHGEAKRAWATREAEFKAIIADTRSAPRPVDGGTPSAAVSAAQMAYSSELEVQRASDAARLAQAEQEARDVRRLSQQLTALRLRHDKCLELLGERQRRVEELVLDLAEAREIYRQQIQSLLPP